MTGIYLIGGGGGGATPNETYGRFVQAANGKIALVIVGNDADASAELDEYRVLLAGPGAASQDSIDICIGPEQPLTYEKLAAHSPAGVFVCGGMTPLYQEALCLDSSWLNYLHEAGIPYAGVSAGAAVASRQAIVGGWKVERAGKMTQMVFPGAGEGCEFLDVRAGLGLVPFSVDVHASQWGTLTRLLHAVDTGRVEDGWGIDEDTMLEVVSGRLTVYGVGQAYHVNRTVDGTLEVSIVQSGYSERIE
jgi:cyanophycinase